MQWRYSEVLHDFTALWCADYNSTVLLCCEVNDFLYWGREEHGLIIRWFQGSLLSVIKLSQFAAWVFLSPSLGNKLTVLQPSVTARYSAGGTFKC